MTTRNPLRTLCSRVRQEVSDALEVAGWYSEGNLVIVPSVTSENITAAVDALAKSGFSSVTPDAAPDK
jgi:hypothetical protein